jgi:peptidyl-prolyl cis-trans isomerase C
MFEVPETVHARHVLIKSDEKDDQKTKDAKKAKAEDLQKKLTAGADFATIAKESSDCPSKAEGGELEPFQKGQTVKPFEDAALSQQINAIGPVVETQFGYHIIQVLERSQPKTKSLPEVRNAIANDLQQKKLQEAAAKYVAELESKAHIVYAEGMAPAKQ